MATLPAGSESLSSRGALVLFSGGQDSTTCLAWALQRYPRVETIGFDYRQRHHIELTVRAPLLRALRALFPDWAERLGADHVVDAGVIAQLGSSALTEQRRIEIDQHGLPNTFVPGRNLLFLTLAAALADRRGLSVLVGGMCETDFSGYPDCRDDSLKAMQVALNLGMAQHFVIETPLMWRDKAQTWALADALGGALLTDLIIEQTHTCYLGERGQRQAWGYGCGLCPACTLRASGFARWQSARKGLEHAGAASA